MASTSITTTQKQKQQVSPGQDLSPTSLISKDGANREEDDDDGYSSEDDATRAGSHNPHKRKRSSLPTSVSCELCKQRKVKCDRNQPQCGWCVRNAQMCEYRQRKKPGLRAGYGRELESRLDNLEGVLQSQQQILQQLANYLPTTSAPRQAAPPAPTSTRTLPDASLYMHRPLPYATSIPDVSSPPSLSGHSHGNSNNMPPPQQLQMSQQQPQTTQQQPQPASQQQNPPLSRMPSVAALVDAYATTDPPLESPSLNIPGSSISVSSMTTQDGDLPPYDLLYALVDLFFKHINTWCPILHRRTTLDALFGSNALDEADRILLHAIVATTLRFSTDARLNASSRERFYSKSKQKVLLYGLDNSSVKSLQALVILALDLVGSSNGPPGWNLLALITRSVVQLGLAVETTSMSVSPLYPSIYTLRAMVLPESKDFIEDESRRRLFWMIYLLDRYATIATAFEFALDDKEIDRKLPCRDDLYARNQPVETKWFPTPERPDHEMNKTENLGSFSYYIEILGIMSRVHRFLKKPVDIGALSDVEHWQREYRELDGLLNSWKFNLPSEFGNMSRLFNANSSNNKVVNCAWVMLHITYHTVVIRLHSSAAYPTTRSPIFTPSFSASQRCHNAVEDICALNTYVRNNQMLSNLGPPFAFSLWVAARLLLVHGSTIDHQVNPTIHPLVETLQELGTYWKVAERYATLLQRVLDEYAESEHAPAGLGGERVTPSTVRILADMRRTAYDLDFLISRQPRQLPAAFKSVNVTPGRTPGTNEMEYLDVFDFFNMPRLPVPAEMPANGGNGGDYTMPDLLPNSEFNITNFMYDANSDWFMRNNT